MKRILLSLILSLLGIGTYGQDFTFGEISSNDYNFDRKTIDSNANAVVLKEFGTARLQVDEPTGRIVVVFDYHVRIKIFNKEGFNKATMVIPTYKDSQIEELIQDVQASTFNISNGQISQTDMDRKAIFRENRSAYIQLTKFTLPNIREGSVIEYSYRLMSPLLFNFRTWEFQSDIPKVSSEFVAFIPANYNYNVILRGFYKLSNQKSELNNECLRLSGVGIDCSKMTYTMNNIPAFVEESFMTAASNFKSAIYFELSDVQLINGGKQAYTKSWKDVDHELITNPDIGGQMKRKDVFKPFMPTILVNAKSDLEKAKAVYDYIRKKLIWNNYYGIRTDASVKSILEARTGNVADINLSLIAALSAAELDVEAVLISTRENGVVNKIYPVITEFNYIVAKVNIGDKSYLLDATEPLLPFGLLPLRCINDQGRVLNLKKPSYWIDLKASQKSITTYVLNGSLTLDGKIKGTISTTTMGYAAFNKRKDIKLRVSAAEYVEKLDEQMPSISITKQAIHNLDSVDNPLIEVYDIEFSGYDTADKNQLFINPFFINRITKNPFNLNERTYPIDLGATLDERIIINITLPDKYAIKDKPKDLAMVLPNNGGKYLLQTSMSENVMSMSQILQLNMPIYPADDYLSLKEFYNKIIQNQKTDVLLQKLN